MKRVHDASPRCLRTRRGLSLIELLVVMALLSFIVLGLMAVFNQTQRAFKAGMAQVDVLESGRAAMDIITREVQEMAPLTTAGTNAINCFVQIPGYSELQQDLPGSSAPRTNVLQDFFFVSRVNQEWVGTGYSVLDATNGIGSLYRYSTNIHVRSLDTLAKAYNPALGPYDLFFDAVSQWPDTDEFARVVDGVIHFRVRAYGTNGVLLDPFYDRGVYTNITVNYDPASASQFTYEFRQDALPTALEIELAVVEPDVLERVRALPAAGTVRQEYLAKEAGKVHVFRQRVPIRRANTDAYNQ
jgi:prepilin-type N-terminal cleavage/methylation domain-containing protein